MDPSYSKVLINQWVVPTKRVTSFMTHQYFNMMATFSTMERTEEQKQELLEGAGLRILHIWRPNDMKSECIIEAVAKKDDFLSRQYRRDTVRGSGSEYCLEWCSGE